MRTIITLDLNDKDQAIEQVGNFELLADASSLRLSAWPRLMKANFGNLRDFYLKYIIRNDEGESMYAIYQQGCGVFKLTVFND